MFLLVNAVPKLACVQF